jgi:hypothetical protein
VFYTSKNAGPAVATGEKFNDREAAILEQVTQVRAAVLQEVETMAAEAAAKGSRSKQTAESEH